MKVNLESLINDIEDILKFEDDIEKLKILNGVILRENSFCFVFLTAFLLLIFNSLLFSIFNVFIITSLICISITVFSVIFMSIKKILSIKTNTYLDDSFFDLLPLDNRYLTYKVSKQLNSKLGHLSYIIRSIINDQT